MAGVRRLTWFVGMVILTWPQTANGQGTSPATFGQQNQRFDSMLRNLVDTQMNFGNSVDPYSPVPRATQNVNPQEISRSLSNYVSLVNQLLSGLQVESNYNISVRPLMADAVNIRATLDYLIRQIGISPDMTRISNDFAGLDRQWRSLSHQVKQLPNVSASVLRQIDELDRTNDSLAKTFRFDPQVERVELTRLLSRLDGSFQQLAEDVDYDLFSHPSRDTWARQIGDLQSRASQTQWALTNQNSYADVVRLYKQFFDSWMVLKRQLRTVDNRYIQRNVSRISKTFDRAHELFWIPPVIDGQDILYLADMLKKNVDGITAGVSLQQLIALGNANDVFRRSREFHAQCDEFRRTVASESNLEAIRFDFRRVEAAWADLRSVLLPLQNPKLNQSVELIDRSVTDLRTAMGLPSAVNRSEVVDLASTLNTMTDLFSYDLARSVGQSNRYQPQFRNEAISLATNLRKSAGQLHQSVLQDNSSEAGREQFRQLTRDWARLQDYIGKVEDRDRAQLARTYQQIVPAITKLQVVYGTY
jgi:hypothetical protein